MAKLKVGDVVSHVTRTEEMTVIRLLGHGQVECTWFVATTTQRYAKFPIDDLNLERFGDTPRVD